MTINKLGEADLQEDTTMNRRIRKQRDKKITEAINGLIFIAERREQQRHTSAVCKTGEALKGAAAKEN